MVREKVHLAVNTHTHTHTHIALQTTAQIRNSKLPQYLLKYLRQYLWHKSAKTHKCDLRCLIMKTGRLWS